MKQIFMIMGILAIGFTPAWAQSGQEDFKFQVEAGDDTLGNVESPIDELSEAEEDAAYAGDKSDIRDPEPPLDPKVLSTEAINPPPVTMEKPEEPEKADPCAAYTSARARVICEDRFMKIDRMNAARERRKTSYVAPTLDRGSDEDAVETPVANGVEEGEVDEEASNEEPAPPSATTPRVSPPSMKVDSK